MLLVAARRRTLMARLRREAMTWGPLLVRTWERSSSKVTSRCQCRQVSTHQWPQIQVASSAAVVCPAGRLVTG
jgi:hypothetical protein